MRAVLLLIVPCVFASCAAKVYNLDYRTYPELPELTMSKVLRKIAKVTPGLERKVFHGNYGGPGNNSGEPKDEMDELFRRHDIAYLEGHKRKELIASDNLLVAKLRSLDDSDMSKRVSAYRKRAIRFFRSPISHVLGKPLDVLFGLKKKPIIVPGNGDDGNIQGSAK